MKDQLKNFLNEEQDPRAVEKIAGKLEDLLMKDEEIAYIGVQKKPAITVFPDAIALTNRRIIVCRPKNLGLSLDFTDYTWDEITGTIVKENILGSEFSFSTRTGINVSMEYLPKAQARKIYAFAREQADALKGNLAQPPAPEQIVQVDPEMDAADEMAQADPIIDEAPPAFAEIPVPQSGYRDEKQHPDFDIDSEADNIREKALSGLSQEELFAKLQNYKKLLDNGLIVQSEYDALKKEVLSYL